MNFIKFSFFFTIKFSLFLKNICLKFSCIILINKKKSRVQMKKLDTSDSFWPFSEYFGNNFVDPSNHTKKSSFTIFLCKKSKSQEPKNRKVFMEKLWPLFVTSLK